MKMVISVGSNLENPIENVENALEQIAQKFTLLKRSSLYRTAPVGGPEQGDYINAIAVIDSSLEPLDVLQRLFEIEQAFNRTRDVRWGPRTLDLDLVDVQGVRSDDPNCLLPHPRAHQRAFVLVPWLEVEPDAELTGIGRVEAIGIPDQEVVRL